MNLYADKPGAFSPDDVDDAHALASHLVVAVADAHEIAHRGRAMVNRTIIGQAEGILMERWGLSGDQAFAYLTRLSQHLNRKLVAVAQDVVTSRQVPDLGVRPQSAALHTSGGDDLGAVS